MPKSVALVSAVDPYPSDYGHKVILAGFLEYFIERVGADNVHYVQVGGDPTPAFPTQLHRVPKPSSIAALGNVAMRTGTGRASLQESLLGSRRVRHAIHHALDRISPELEIYDTIRMAQHAPMHNADNQICYLEDLLSQRYRAMLRAMHRYPDVSFQAAGTFAAFIPGPFRALAAQNVSLQLLLRIEERLARRSEDRNARHFRSTLLVNEGEADCLRRSSGANPGRIQAVPPLIKQAKPMPRNYGGAPVFVFLGQLRVPHNDDGLRSFLKNVWPRVLVRQPDARLRVLGGQPRPPLVELAAQYADTVSLEGFVPDLAEAFGQAAALVNPLRFGSGVKVKILEALYAGLPVISTSLGADGIATGTDEGVLVADDDAHTADLLHLVTDRAKNLVLSSAAKEHFVSRYSKEVVLARYDTVFGLG